MATAQAASASPTHHRASPGTSPPQPPYPSAARIADSACFPQYTASLKCMRPTLSNRRNPQSGAAVSFSPRSLRTCAFTRELFLCSDMLYGHSLMLSLFLKVWRPTRTRASASSSSTITRSARRKRFAFCLPNSSANSVVIHDRWNQLFCSVSLSVGFPRCFNRTSLGCPPHPPPGHPTHTLLKFLC